MNYMQRQWKTQQGYFRQHGMDAAELQMMVQEKNSTVVDEKEVLSDSVYEYDEKSKELNKVIGRDEPEQEKGREI